MKTIFQVSLRITWPSSRCCAPWDRHKKMSTSIWEETKMATQLQPPQPEVVSQQKEVLRAHPVEGPIEPAPAPKRSAGATMKHYRKTPFVAALIVLLVAGTAGWM